MIDKERRHERGQVLPLFALFLVVLLGFAALAIDVSGALSARRFYRSVADGASLAGAQDLQQTGSRAVAPGDRMNARKDAMGHVTTELGIAGALPAACDTWTIPTDVDVTDACLLPGTNYHVSIKAGAYAGQVSPIACSECDPARSVQVNLRNANYGLSFSRVFGQRTWSVGISSVAGLQWSKSYAVVTLRPPAKLGSSYDVKDVLLDGNDTQVFVSTGDVATNSNMDYNGLNAQLHLDAGFNMLFADWTGGQLWPSPPVGTKIFTYITDPNYTYPAMSGTRGFASCSPGPATNCAPTFTDARESVCGAPNPLLPCTTPAADPAGCGAEVTYLRTSVYTFMATQDPTRIYCYKPGIYDPSSNPKQLIVANGDVVILMPGAYYFKSPYGGLDVSGRLIGGYRPGSEGVALMFDECNNQCTFTGNNAVTIALNVGTKFPPGTSGASATAAHDWNDQAVQTSGPSSPTPPILMTLLVKKDPKCAVPAYPNREPALCNASDNTTIFVAGGGSLAVEGVQYGPTDNMEIKGGSTGVGQVGQIWAWTLKYTGSTKVNQQGAGSLGPGVLRLDSACTAPGTPCSP
jgi:hypothetical protein